MIPIFERHGFHFARRAITTSTGENMFLIIKVPGRSSVEYPKYSVWEYSEDEYVEFINKFDIKCADVLLDDFSMLTRCPGLEMLNLYPSFQAPNHVSYEPVYQMPNLRMLQPTTVYSYDKYWTEFDCAKLLSANKLEWFGADCKKGIKNLNSLTGLKTLSLSHYKAPDMSEVVNSSRLDTVDLLRCGIQSLKGLEKTSSLKVLKLSTCTMLKDIDALYDAGSDLQGLVIESCSKIEDFSVLGSLKNLKRLSLIGTGSIPSLSFIDELPNLRTLVIEMTITDGDLSYCDRLENTSVIKNKRHHNRKNSQFPKLQRPYVTFGDEEIEEWRRHVIS